jgi:hypothetical protein
LVVNSVGVDISQDRCGLYRERCVSKIVPPSDNAHTNRGKEFVSSRAACRSIAPLSAITVEVAINSGNGSNAVVKLMDTRIEHACVIGSGHITARYERALRHSTPCHAVWARAQHVRPHRLATARVAVRDTRLRTHYSVYPIPIIA